MRRRTLFLSLLLSFVPLRAQAGDTVMVSALLHVDIADASWFSPDTTVEIEVDLKEHVFTRAALGNDVRGVFATYSGRRIMLLRKASEVFRWAPGCAVAVVVPSDGRWPDGGIELGQLDLEDVAKAVVEVPGGGWAKLGHIE